MKKYSTLIAFSVAVLLGLGAAIMANHWLESKGSEQLVVKKAEVPMSKVVIANQPLVIGTLLTTENLSLVDWPKANMPVGTYQNIADVEGRIIVNKTVSGMPVLTSSLAAPGSGVGLVAVIKPGKRAMSIRVDEVIGVGGFILPNTFVDVISVQKVEGQKQRKVKTILEKIEVLAIAQETYTEEGKAKIVRTVTLELEPKQAEKLALETNEGEIHLILRNPLDEVTPEIKKVVEVKSSVPVLRSRVRVPQSSPHEVQVIRGSRPVEKVEFQHVNSEQRI